MRAQHSLCRTRAQPASPAAQLCSTIAAWCLCARDRLYSIPDGVSSLSNCHQSKPKAQSWLPARTPAWPQMQALKASARGHMGPASASPGLGFASRPFRCSVPATRPLSTRRRDWAGCVDFAASAAASWASCSSGAAWRQVCGRVGDRDACGGPPRPLVWPGTAGCDPCMSENRADACGWAPSSGSRRSPGGGGRAVQSAALNAPSPPRPGLPQTPTARSSTTAGACLGQGRRHARLRPLADWLASWLARSTMGLTGMLGACWPAAGRSPPRSPSGRRSTWVLRGGQRDAVVMLLQACRHHALFRWPCPPAAALIGCRRPAPHPQIVFLVLGGWGVGCAAAGCCAVGGACSLPSFKLTSGSQLDALPTLYSPCALPALPAASGAP